MAHPIPYANIKRAFLNCAASGNTEIVAAQGTGIKIRVISVSVIAAAANTVKFQSATTDITSAAALPANGGYVKNSNEYGWMQTAANEALNVNCSASNAVAVDVTYVLTTV